MCRTLLILYVTLSVPVVCAGESALIEAIKNNQDQAGIVPLIDQSENINLADMEGATPLHWAVQRDNTDIVVKLLQSGADPDLANPYGVTPLWLACTNRNSAIIEKLLSSGANPNAVPGTNESVLMNCVRTGTTVAIEPLIKAGAEVNHQESEKGQTALMWAAASKYPDITRLLIELGAATDAKSSSGYTPLLFAVSSGDIESARLLIEAGVSVNETLSEYGNALVLAAASGHDEMALFLIRSGADIQSEDSWGVTPLHYAVRGGLSLLDGVIYDAAYRTRPRSSIELASTLLEAGADPDRQIKKNRMLGPDGTPFLMEGATPFLLAAAAADIPMMQLLKKYKADIDKPTSEAVTPFMAATQATCTGTCAYQEGGNVASKQDVEKALNAVRFLMEEGVDVNHADNKGRTAMHIAAFTGSDPVVQFLADRGARIDVKNLYGETPWSMASGMSPSLENTGLYGKHESTAALLLKLGASPVLFEDLIDPYAPVPDTKAR